MARQPDYRVACVDDHGTLFLRITDHGNVVRGMPIEAPVPAEVCAVLGDMLNMAHHAGRRAQRDSTLAALGLDHWAGDVRLLR